MNKIEKTSCNIKWRDADIVKYGSLNGVIVTVVMLFCVSGIVADYLKYAQKDNC